MGSEFGRIDPDGTVFLITADGAREIGSWQAGDAEAGFAFYERRYEDRPRSRCSRPAWNPVPATQPRPRRTPKH
jgi:hypothetical protein